MDKFSKFVRDKQLTVFGHNFGFSTIGEIKSNKKWDIKYFNDSIRVSSFEQDVTLDVGGCSDDTPIAYVNIINDEGDCGAFAYDDDRGGIDYDIDLDYFSNKQREMYNIFNTPNSGIDINSSNVTYGAARNG